MAVSIRWRGSIDYGGLDLAGGLDRVGVRRFRERWRAWSTMAGSMARSMVLAASTAAGSIDNDVGGRVTIDGDGGG